MSRLWDTNAIYVRAEVDELLRDYPGWSTERLVQTFGQSHPAYEGDPEFAREIMGELRKRVEAGVRFWPEPPGLDEIAAEVRTIIERTTATLVVVGPEPEEPGYWWQRM